MFGHDSNKSGNAYFFQALCPIRRGTVDGEDRSYESAARDAAADLQLGVHSPFAAVPNTYFARFYVLKDVFYEGKPAKVDHLKSQYLVFAAHFHGDRDTWLRDVWTHAGTSLEAVFENCVAFEHVLNADSFTEYADKCQVNTSLPFNGSTDQPLAEQLKGLFLKQQFSAFVSAHQNLAPSELKQEFEAFLHRAQIGDQQRPTWRPGASSLQEVEVL